MIKIFKWWWAWKFEEVEDWLERMEASGLRLVGTRLQVFFNFEKCIPTKARYCIDYQTKLTPEYLTIISDDGWKLYQVGMGWYILRKEYQEERPELYTDFEALIARNKTLLAIILICLAMEFVFLGSMIWSIVRYPSEGLIAETCILGALVLSLFTFAITNLAMQISKFSKRK